MPCYMFLAISVAAISETLLNKGIIFYKLIIGLGCENLPYGEVMLCEPNESGMNHGVSPAKVITKRVSATSESQPF